MDYKLGFIISAENRAKEAIDQVKGQLDSVQDKLKDMQPAFQKMALVGTAAFAAVTGAVTLSIKAAAEAEKSWAKVGQQIKLSGMDFDETIPKIKNFASGMQSLTGISDELIGEFVGRMLPVTKDVEKAFDATRMAMDLSVGTGKDFSAIQTIMTMVMSGNIEALRRYLPELKGLDAEQLNAMSSAEKTAFAMEAIRKQFGGLAETEGKTATGQMNMLKETFGDLQETIGTQFLPIIISLVEKLRPVIENIMQWVEENPKLTMIIIIATAAISGLVAIIGLLGMALPGIIIMFSHLSAVSLPITGIILAIIVVIGLLIKIGWELYHNWDEIIMGYKIMFEEWKAKIIEIWTKVRDFFINLWDDISEIFDVAIAKIMGFLQPLLNAIESAKSGLSFISGAVGSTVGKIFGGKQFGGVIPTTGTYMLHRGEMVTPANAIAGGGIVVNILGGTYLSETVAEEIGDMIIEKLKINRRL